jgi:hypothetical protein
MPFSEIPHGKQSWYGPQGGIWQSVMLEARPAVHLAGARISAGMDGRLEAIFRVEGAAEGSAGPAVTIADADGKVLAEAQGSAVSGGESRITLTVANVRRWSPDDPHLHSLTARLAEGDTLVEPFGFRTIEARDGRILVNGAPIYLRSALDQDYYPDLICTPPSLAYIEAQFREAKAFGLNSLRIHIKVPDPRYYQAADRIGLLIWTEVPNHHVHTPAAAARHRATMEGLVARDFNHPSIFAWTIINEDWGTEVREDRAHREWLRESYHHLKRLDPTRLVVDNSPCGANFHLITDIDDYHWYHGQPDQRRNWDRLTDEFADRAAWSFSPHGDATRSGSEPLVVSEFGNWGLPLPKDVVGADGAEPWWFETGHEKAEGVVYPHGWDHRYQQHALDDVFGTLEDFARATQDHQYEALKYEIESMRRRPEIQGYVVTEFTDCHWECNGLLDMRRNPRLFRDALARVNADTVIVARPPRWSATDGETLAFEVVLAHGGGRTLPAGVLFWSIDGAEVGRCETPAFDEPGAARIDGVSVRLAGSPRVARIGFRLTDTAGRTLAENDVDIAVLPMRTAPSLVVDCDDAGLAGALAAAGYDHRKAGSPVLITRHLADRHYAALAEGRNVLLIADQDDAFGNTFAERRFPRLQHYPRRSTPWLGDWASSFGWLARRGAFAALPGPTLMGLPFDRIIPRHVITGFRPFEFQAGVEAGITVGWVQRPAVCLGSKSWGAGRLVMSTFAWPDDAAADPMAAAFCDALLAHAAEPGPAARRAPAFPA